MIAVLRLTPCFGGASRKSVVSRFWFSFARKKCFAGITHTVVLCSAVAHWVVGLDKILLSVLLLWGAGAGETMLVLFVT